MALREGRVAGLFPAKWSDVDYVVFAFYCGFCGFRSLQQTYKRPQLHLYRDKFQSQYSACQHLLLTPIINFRFY
jgi:hypothetical protein